MIGSVGCFRMVGFHRFVRRANGNGSATRLRRASSIRDRKEDSMNAMGCMLGGYPADDLAGGGWVGETVARIAAMRRAVSVKCWTSSGESGRSRIGRSR